MGGYAVLKASGAGRAEPTQFHGGLATACNGSCPVVDSKSYVLQGEKDGFPLAQKASTILWGKDPEGFLRNPSSSALRNKPSEEDALY